MMRTDNREWGPIHSPRIGIYINRARQERTPLLLLFSLLLLAACMPITPDEPAPAPASDQMAVEEPRTLPLGVHPIEQSGAAAAAVDAEETALPQGTLTINRPRANIRSGPSTAYLIVSRAVEGDTFTTTGRTDGGWWRVCCVAGPSDDPDEPTQSAWLSAIVADPDAASTALPLIQPLFPGDLSSSWNVNYECGSRRCAVSECAAVSRTELLDTPDLRWLEINRIVTWEGACGEDSTWPHQIDRFEGTERYPNSTGLFFFNYWVGPRPGEANALFQTDAGEEIEVWCSDEQEAEVIEDSGWTTAYRGVTCYDIRTGMLMAMEYTKRWFFTGEFEGDKYERAYFGDSEVYRVTLDQTNAQLAVVNADASE